MISATIRVSRQVAAARTTLSRRLGPTPPARLMSSRSVTTTTTAVAVAFPRQRQYSAMRSGSSLRSFVDLSKQQQQTHHAAVVRSFSSLDSNFEPKPPDKLTSDMAEGILDTTQFYIRYGISKQRLHLLAQNPDLPVIERWQQMMEIYITTQLHVIAGIGYPASAEGLGLYAQHLTVCIQSADATMRELFTEMRRDTWREIVATVFSIEPKDIPILSIVDARKLMHKVASKMMEPDTLLAIQNQTAKIQDNDIAMELQRKHKILQEILVERVYLGVDSSDNAQQMSLVEETGFGSGAVGYAKLQCALSDHEGDPLMADYAASAMMKILSAAGIDIDSIQGPGLGASAV